MLGGHARPRQSVEDRKGPLRDTEGRQNGNDLHVLRARRELNFQELENALGTPLPAVIKGYATLRDAKLAESSFDKVVMWTGGSYDYDDVVRALVRLDRPEKRPGTSGQSGMTVPTYFTDPEVGAPTIVPGSEIQNQAWDRPHWNELLDVLQEEPDFCEDGETTIARDGAIAIPGVFYITDDGQEAVEENEVPQILRVDQLSDILGTGLSERISIMRRIPWVSSAPDEVQVAEIRGARMERSSIQQLKLRTSCARCRKLGHWARAGPEGNRGQCKDERYDRRATRSEENSKGFITLAGPTGRRPFFLGASWTFVTLDPGEVLWDTGAQEGLVGKQQLDKWCKLLPGEARIRKRHWRRDATNRCCVCASWFGWVQQNRTTIKESQEITCQPWLTCTRDPGARTTTHQQGTTTQHPHTIEDHGRRQHRMATDLRDLIRQIFPRHHFGSRVVNKRTVFFKNELLR